MSVRLSNRHFSIMSRLQRLQIWNRDTHNSGQSLDTEPFRNPDNKRSITRGVVPIHAESTLWSVPESPQNARTLRASIIGLPNAGKSSLLNSLLSTSLAAVSPKVNTTRENITAVLTRDNCQIVFVDNPGIIPFQYKRSFGKELLRAAWRGYHECDVCILVVDVVKRPCSQLFQLIRSITPKTIKSSSQPTDSDPLTESLIEESDELLEAGMDECYNRIPVILVLNKSDLLDSIKWAKSRFKELKVYGSFSQVIYTSAKKNLGIEYLLDVLERYSKQSPWIYPHDLLTPMSKIQILEQSIRTYIFCWFNKDLPYKIGHKTVGWTKIDDTTTLIEHELYTKTDLAAKIICGTGGKIIARIQDKVAKKLSHLWKMNIRLNIHVKTDRNKLPL
ncbi:GTPase Era [Babesia microti strain RI]|uniref:GTPase Era n=1 Tax=Babesia microti (strain RI) TaxID=1133968 RepID=A0A1N6LXU9_BABMR|nr:GTPase Era [Babesia microti strain RI]SIO73697.1 GTPase Era [Babesia microti strain RI]|eukprot:XP_021337765.1 GTPase Era [Babesia microti strain RI]